MSIPNIDRNVLSIPHEDKLSIPHIEKRLLSICHIDNCYTCGIKYIFMSILGIGKFSIYYV